MIWRYLDIINQINDVWLFWMSVMQVLKCVELCTI